jgi:tryptophan-rich sensory protein
LQFLQKKEKLAALLLTPYLLWICFAAFLNYKSISKVEACSATEPL